MMDSSSSGLGVVERLAGRMPFILDLEGHGMNM
jgi:hypothetical protein